MTPFGNLLGGVLAERIGAPTTLVIDGIVCILGSILFARQLPKLKELVLPIYEKRGIY